MTSITIITIVVVALLTVIIFGLAWLGWSSCLKAYKIEADQGKHDTEITKEYQPKKKNKGGLIGLIGSYLALLALSSLFVTGIVYKVNGENFEINNQTALVIKSGSMSEYYDEKRAEDCSIYPEYHFDVGDICIFERVAEETELVEGEVYGYKYKNIIITHRLVEKTSDGYYRFWGDNNPVPDQLLIKKDNIIYHYVGNKVPGIGAFVLYAQSYFGIWSLVGIISIAISSEIVYYKLDKINKARYALISKQEDDIAESKQEELKTEADKREIKVQFRRKDGTLVTIYKKNAAQKAEVLDNEK